MGPAPIRVKMSIEEEIHHRLELGPPDDIDDIVFAIESDELEEFDDWDGDGEEGK